MQQVTNRLDTFLVHPQKRVLVLKGRWGVGKTYFWKQYITKKGAAGIKESKISYVSLFGIKSSEELEQLVLAKTIPTSKRQHVITKASQALAWANDIPKIKDFVGLIRRIGSLFIKDYLVCLDDIERRDSSFSMVSLIGFVSQLKEENQCRLVLILNDEVLSKPDTEELQKYREKVIDETITYAPSPEDNLHLVFTDKSDFDSVSPTFVRLRVNNIRIMHQTKWALDHFRHYENELFPTILRQLHDHIIMLSCFYHDPGMGVDVFNLPRGSIYSFYFNAAGDSDEKAKEQHKLCYTYGYNPAEYDQYIIDYLMHGECDEDQFKVQLLAVNGKEKTSQVMARYESVWKLYNANFQVAKSDLITKFIQFLDETAEHLTYRQLKETTDFLKKLNVEADYSKWFNSFVRSKQTSTKDISVLNNLLQLTTDPQLLKEIKEQINLLKNKITIISQIIYVVRAESWSPEMVSHLNSFTIDDFKNELLQSNDEELLSYIPEFVNMWKQSGEHEQAVIKNLCLALQEIAAQDKLNEDRIRNIIPYALRKSDDSNPTNIA